MKKARKKLRVYVESHSKAIHDKAVEWGCESTFAPQRLDRWPVIAAFFLDPDGYLVELIQHVTA